MKVKDFALRMMKSFSDLQEPSDKFMICFWLDERRLGVIGVCELHPVQEEQRDTLRGVM